MTTAKKKKRTNVNAQVYRQQINEHFHGDLETFCWLNNVDTEKQVFQQDGDTAHIDHENICLLQEMFPNQLTSRHSDFPYPT
jgi:hypothetical protein